MPNLNIVNPELKSIATILLNMLKKNFMYYIFFRGNKVKFLRWLGAKIGENCQIYAQVSGIGSEPWLVEIGNRVILANGVQFITHDGASRLIRSKIPNSSIYGNNFGRILIHDDCFIGMNTIIMPDVEIGPNSIVGLGSIVTKNILPDMVYAGIPAKPICTLDEYITHYKEKMIDIKASNRQDLRSELTKYFWGFER